MVIISYHASHEQFSPSVLLDYAKEAEKAGFDACHSSDHFHPWSVRQGQSGFSFSWLGAALEATSFPFSLVNAPGQRLHPAIVAQAIATLTQMYPGRLDIAFGTGEALNERITGEPWPEKPIRNQRLLECITIMRRLLNGETVSYEGIVKVKEATLYTRPMVQPKFMAAAMTEETARWAGSWADGLLTAYQEIEKIKKIIVAFKEGGGEGKPLHVQMAFSYARNRDKVLRETYEQWRSNLVGLYELENFSRPEQFDEITKFIQVEELEKKLLISSDLNLYKDRINECIQFGFENIILHNVNLHQKEFIHDFGKQILPEFKNKVSHDTGIESII